MNWGGYTEHGQVLHGLTDEGRAACGVVLAMVIDVSPGFLVDMATCRRCEAAGRGRPTYVYRLKVEYPEGVGPNDPPKGWEPLVVDTADGPEQQVFSWPTRRYYLSREGAQDRARLLREWGCTVTIERSEPVTWA